MVPTLPMQISFFSNARHILCAADDSGIQYIKRPTRFTARQPLATRDYSPLLEDLGEELERTVGGRDSSHIV